jgi:hypothetical protein
MFLMTGTYRWLVSMGLCSKCAKTGSMAAILSRTRDRLLSVFSVIRYLPMVSRNA